MPIWPVYLPILCAWYWTDIVPYWMAIGMDMGTGFEIFGWEELGLKWEWTCFKMEMNSF